MPRISAQTIRDKYRRVAAASQSYTWFNYQPINLPGYEETLALAGRNCFDRCAAVVDSIEQRFGERKLRLIDWGCNLGFFVFELAKRGHDVVGVDSNAEFVEICRYLADSHEFPVRPRFFTDKMTEASLANYSAFDAALCFSVFHHHGKALMPLLRRFAELYPSAFIEMDGRDYGRHQLFPFYFETRKVAETNDPYGSGTRRRKTWFCTNDDGPTRYCNLKEQNLLGGRAVLKKTSPDGTSVVKREELKSSHTWIRTNLAVETENYRKWGGTDFFPAFRDAGENAEFRWLEIEYIDNDRAANLASIDHFFAFLSAQQLFLLDIGEDSFLFKDGQLKVVDLESLFPVTTSIADLLADVARKSTIRLDTYEKQRNYIVSRVLR